MAIACALYGKVQTRRDFIAVATGRAFLSAWEPWLQNGVAASRDELRERWNDAFLTAPIWRFFLGADICGAAALGAIMPSMDGIGRYFPLTFVACADDEHTFDPPERDAQSDWFVRCEAFLLSTLAIHDHAALLYAFGQTPPPRARPDAEPGERVAFGPHGIVRPQVDGRSFETCFEIARTSDPRRTYSSSSFWWTVGGRDYAPCAFACPRLPSPFLFSSMLTGRFPDGGG